jgi:photosystem II stability/assembly factor-like uncharacterized protein
MFTACRMKYIPVLLLFSLAAFSQKKAPTKQLISPGIDFDKQFSAMQYRSIGPTRGGRSTAVAGIPSQPQVFFMGTTGGGVWKTDDGGNTWNNVTDGQIAVGSIGSIRVALSDPNVIYVGTGSADPRGNVSIGKGIYKSTDAGKTWLLVGLEKGGQIGRIEIHPQNPDLVFAAVLGNPFAYNSERGVFRSTDGGKNWQRVLFINDKTGAMNIVMDPNNPRILYAGMWQVQRKPWTLIDGGPDGGVYQSKDGGDTWKKLEDGLPTGVMGKIGIAVSPANSDRVWVLLETPDDSKGGLYRSDDGAKTFKRINGDRELRTRHWYYTHVFADPKDQETVFVNNVSFWKSTDGGNSFSSIRVLHGDCHDLWINSNNTSIMIHSNDGGAHVTYNGGKTWSSIFNVPTAEFYRVEVDNNFPYRVYGCQQDNTSISVSSAGREGGRSGVDWITWGGEAGHVAVDPKTGVIYSGEYSGLLFRYDHKSGHQRTIQDYPQLHDGLPLHKVKYRFQWNAPITISPHNSDVVYHCSQFVHKTMDGGQTWQLISPDLTLNKKEYQELPGGPVQIDYTGVENFNTIFVMEESPITPNELWVGTDDGLVHISMDGGKNWNKITPPGIPPLATINSIDISAFKRGKAIVTVQNYRLGDFKPYIFKTVDYGKTWTTITQGLPANFFVRVVREDPNREGLLFGGTEFGMFVSMDDGKNWNPLQLNLPRTPITDLLIKNKDLVISTQGRSFWILDDLSALEQWTSASSENPFTLFTPRIAVRSQVGGGPKGAEFQYFLKEKPDSTFQMKLEIIDAAGIVRKVFSNKTGKDFKGNKITPKEGLNRLVWNFQYDAPLITDGTVFGYGKPDGVLAPTGQYRLRATVDSKIHEVPFTISKDPRWSATDADLLTQYELSSKAADEINRVHLTIRKIRSIRTQANDVVGRAGEIKAALLKPLAETMNDKLTALENELTQTKSKAGQDPINYPPMFDEQWNWLLQLLNTQDAKPNQGCYDLYADLKEQTDAYMAQFELIVNNELKTFNETLVKENVTGVMLEAVEK